jgi:hypothetical protein
MEEACGDKAPDIVKFGLTLRTNRIFTNNRYHSDSWFMLHNHTVYNGAMYINAAMY